MPNKPFDSPIIIRTENSSQLIGFESILVRLNEPELFRHQNVMRAMREEDIRKAKDAGIPRLF